MTFIMMIVASVIVGILAQSWKRRTGVVWGFITLLVMILTWFVLYIGTYMVQPDLYKTEEGWYALGVMVSGSVGILMALIIATLPSKKLPQIVSGASKQCPFCAELIKRDAKICRYCGRDLPIEEKDRPSKYPDNNTHIKKNQKDTLEHDINSSDVNTQLPQKESRNDMPIDYGAQAAAQSVLQVRSSKWAIIIWMVIVGTIVASPWISDAINLYKVKYFEGNREEIIRTVKQYIDQGKYAEALTYAEKYSIVYDKELNQLEGEASFKSNQQQTNMASSLNTTRSSNPASDQTPTTTAYPGPMISEPTKANQSGYEKDIRKATTSEGLTKADLAWHAQNTYGWNCEEVVSSGRPTKDGYFIITCSNGTKLRVYPRLGQHPRITNVHGNYK